MQPPNTVPSTLLKIPALAKRLGLGITKTRQLIANREIEHIRIGRSITVSEEALAKFLAARSIPAE